MKTNYSAHFTAFPLVLPVLMGGLFVMASHAQAVTEIGGQKIVTLTRTATSKTKPEFTSVTLAPGRGMELIQITANFPGKGNVDVLASPDLAGAKEMLDEKDNANGDLGYRLGSAFLVPYPNRIRGKLSADGKTLTTAWEGHTITLPANNIGKHPGAERHAMHGLILKAKTDDVTVKDIPGGQEVTGVIHAGNFGGHWLSKTDLVYHHHADRRRRRREHRGEERGQRSRTHGHWLAPVLQPALGRPHPGAHPYSGFRSGRSGQLR